MIPHHHHEFDMDEISGNYDHPGHYSHHDSDSHHHHNDIEKKKHENTGEPAKGHNHNFPFHNHLSAANDFDFLRIKLNRNISINQIVLGVINTYPLHRIVRPPDIDIIRFTDIPFHIKSVFLPGAIGLRAPPSIA